MNLVDSSGWLEYFGGTKNASHFRQAIHDTHKLIVPTIVVFEVFKKLLNQVGKEKACQAIGQMHRANIAELSLPIALQAATLSEKSKLPAIDSLIYTTAQTHNATLWTQDSDFIDLPNVKYFPKTC